MLRCSGTSAVVQLGALENSTFGAAMSPQARRADPQYVQVAGQIGMDIASGRLNLGGAVPSARQICAAWGMAPATETKAPAARC
jgi:Bacterial regulatory proteins, gntR family